VYGREHLEHREATELLVLLRAALADAEAGATPEAVDQARRWLAEELPRPPAPVGTAEQFNQALAAQRQLASHGQALGGGPFGSIAAALGGVVGQAQPPPARKAKWLP